MGMFKSSMWLDKVNSEVFCISTVVNSPKSAYFHQKSGSNQLPNYRSMEHHVQVLEIIVVITDNNYCTKKRKRIKRTNAAGTFSYLEKSKTRIRMGQNPTSEIECFLKFVSYYFVLLNSIILALKFTAIYKYQQTF